MKQVLIVLTAFMMGICIQTTLNAMPDSSKYRIVSMYQSPYWYNIVAHKDGRYYHVVSLNDSTMICDSCEQLRIGSYYELELIEIFPNAPIDTQFIDNELAISFKLSKRSRFRYFEARNISGISLTSNLKEAEEIYAHYKSIHLQKNTKVDNNPITLFLTSPQLSSVNTSQGMIGDVLRARPPRFFHRFSSIPNSPEPINRDSDVLIERDTCPYKIIKIKRKTSCNIILAKKERRYFQIIIPKIDSNWLETCGSLQLGRLYKLDLLTIFPVSQICMAYPEYISAECFFPDVDSTLPTSPNIYTVAKEEYQNSIRVKFRLYKRAQGRLFAVLNSERKCIQHSNINPYEIYNQYYRIALEKKWFLKRTWVNVTFKKTHAKK